MDENIAHRFKLLGARLARCISNIRRHDLTTSWRRDFSFNTVQGRRRRRGERIHRATTRGKVGVSLEIARENGIAKESFIWLCRLCGLGRSEAKNNKESKQKDHQHHRQDGPNGIMFRARLSGQIFAKASGAKASSDGTRSVRTIGAIQVGIASTAETLGRVLGSLILSSRSRGGHGQGRLVGITFFCDNTVPDENLLPNKSPQKDAE